jgi:hypothetical protein
MEFFSLWDEAASDLESENRERAIHTASLASAGVWAFLAAAKSEPEFDTRLALAESNLSTVAAESGLSVEDVTDIMRRRYALLLEASSNPFAKDDDDDDDSDDSDSDSDDDGDDDDDDDSSDSDGDDSGSDDSDSDDDGDDSGDDDSDDSSDDDSGNPFAKDSSLKAQAYKTPECKAGGDGQCDGYGPNSEYCECNCHSDWDLPSTTEEVKKKHENGDYADYWEDHHTSSLKQASGKSHEELDADFDKAFADLKDAGLEHDADHPIAERYRAASDAVNHSNRKRDYGIATGEIKTSAYQPKTYPAGSKVFVPHFMGEEELDGQKGFHANVISPPGEHGYADRSEEHLMEKSDGTGNRFFQHFGGLAVVAVDDDEEEGGGHCEDCGAWLDEKGLCPSCLPNSERNEDERADGEAYWSSKRGETGRHGALRQQILAGVNPLSPEFGKEGYGKALQVGLMALPKVIDMVKGDKKEEAPAEEPAAGGVAANPMDAAKGLADKGKAVVKQVLAQRGEYNAEESDYSGLVTGHHDGGPTWPKTDSGWCDYFHALDDKHGNTPTFKGTSGNEITDPLHHDSRCPIHSDHPNYRSATLHEGLKMQIIAGIDPLSPEFGIEKEGWGLALKAAPMLLGLMGGGDKKEGAEAAETDEPEGALEEGAEAGRLPFAREGAVVHPAGSTVFVPHPKGDDEEGGKKGLYAKVVSPPGEHGWNAHAEKHLLAPADASAAWALSPSGSGHEFLHNFGSKIAMGSQCPNCGSDKALVAVPSNLGGHAGVKWMCQADNCGWTGAPSEAKMNRGDVDKFASVEVEAGTFKDKMQEQGRSDFPEVGGTALHNGVPHKITHVQYDDQEPTFTVHAEDPQGNKVKWGRDDNGVSHKPGHKPHVYFNPQKTAGAAADLAATTNTGGIPQAAQPYGGGSNQATTKPRQQPSGGPGGITGPAGPSGPDGGIAGPGSPGDDNMAGGIENFNPSSNGGDAKAGMDDMPDSSAPTTKDAVLVRVAREHPELSDEQVERVASLVAESSGLQYMPYRSVGDSKWTENLGKGMAQKPNISTKIEDKVKKPVQRGVDDAKKRVKQKAKDLKGQMKQQPATPDDSAAPGYQYDPSDAPEPVDLSEYDVAAPIGTGKHRGPATSNSSGPGRHRAAALEDDMPLLLG